MEKIRLHYTLDISSPGMSYEEIAKTAENLRVEKEHKLSMENMRDKFEVIVDVRMLSESLALR